MQGLPASAQVSFLVTGIVLLGWMLWGVREYRRTGRGTWLWLGALMGASLLVAIARFPR